MDKYIDLHSHSVYSDGEFTPLELIEMSRERNIGVLSITDHNRVDAYKNFDYKSVSDVRVIPGVELSSQIDKGQLHILGLNIDPFNKELNEELNRLKEVSRNSVKAIIKQIDIDYDIKFPLDEVKKLLESNHNIGRPDIAKLLIKYGYVSSVSDAFDRFLIQAYDKTREYRKLLTYKESIDLIKISGGIAVLAHPKSLKLSEKELLMFIKELVSVGLLGIEVYHSSHSREEMEMYLNIANLFGLYVSGGSDYHGPLVKPDIELGSGKNNNLNIRKLSIMDCF